MGGEPVLREVGVLQPLLLVGRQHLKNVFKTHKARKKVEGKNKMFKIYYKL